LESTPGSGLILHWTRVRLEKCAPIR
jgi:hypothetical protein